MIIFVDIFLIIGILFFCIGFGKVLIDSAAIILLIIAVIAICLIMLGKYPGVTLICLSVLVVVLIFAGIGASITKESEENSVPVTISKATATCTVYDIDRNVVEIPIGSIIARYTDENDRKSEHIGKISSHEFARHCYWYYNGEVNHFFVSSLREYTSETLAEYIGNKKNDWNVIEIAEIPYKEFSNSQWWQLAE